ncbi:MAG: CRISPR-associated endonuclease Cas2, partial [Patescibacteria group bacterium]
DREILYNVAMKTETKEKILSGSKLVLTIIGLVGFVAVAVVAGNMVQLLKYTSIMKKSKLKVYEINQNVKRLIERGLIQISEDKNYKYLELTEKGKRLLLKLKIEGLIQDKPKKWDKRYRVVIFDIPEGSRKIRDELRKTIQGFGFICIQKSVWLYPYPCQNIIELLKQFLGVHGEVVYMTVDSIENDAWIKDFFKLK